MEKRSIYHLHIELDKEYCPVHKRNKCAEVSASIFQAMREDQKKHIDLWTDGRLYPVDPIMKNTPPFSNYSSLVKFVGDGQRVLWGYTQFFFAAERDILKLEDHLSKQMINTLKQQLEECKERKEKLQTHLKQARRKNTMLGDRQRKKKLKNIEALRRGEGSCSKRIKATRTLLQPNSASNMKMVAKHCFTSQISKKIFKEKKFEKAKQQCIEGFLQSSCLDKGDVQYTMDKVGISRDGYNQEHEGKVKAM
ncbi:hypothetical protein L7F22_063577 [Adiantum nelumboides]|nr:hypothetical protein [Adiantum nelumboides]